MKKLFFSIVIAGISFAGQSQINYQAGSYYYDNPIVPLTTFTPVNSFTSSLGYSNTLSGNFSTAIGRLNMNTGSNSFTVGRGNIASGVLSQSFGMRVQTEGDNAFTFGNGGTSGYLINTHDNSFLVGFSSQPAFYVSTDVSNRPVVGIATETPESRLHIMMDDKQDVIIQSTVPGTYTGISFRHNTGIENWRIRSFSNFPGGYGNMLGITSSSKGDFWIAAEKTIIGDYFDFSGCTDHDEFKLFVKKGIRTERIKVDVASGVWADYVFEDNYNLLPLAEVKTFIASNGHLPNISSAQTIEEEGLDLGAMNVKLLEKIEELTLYLINQQETIDGIQSELNQLKTKN